MSNRLMLVINLDLAICLIINVNSVVLNKKPKCKSSNAEYSTFSNYQDEMFYEL